MKALRRCPQNCPRAIIGLSLVVVLAAGCKDLTSHSEPDSLQTAVGQVTPETPQPVAGTADTVQPGEQPRTVPVEPGQTTDATGQDARPSTVSPATPPPKPSIAIPAKQPDEIYEPTVILSRAHQETCLVGVGDPLPELTLSNLAGEAVSLKELRGDKLTVVVFWSNQQALAREQFRRLPDEVALPFRHLDLKVVAVNVGDPVEQIELEEKHEEITCLLDPAGAAIAKVATEKLPRTYLLDAQGQILWFDIEYSRTTRRQLKNAIFYFSRELKSDAS